MKLARILSFVLSLVMALTAFAGCANSANGEVYQPDSVVTDAPEVTDSPETEGTPEVTTTEATAEAVTTTEETTTEATTTVATTTTPETTTVATTTTEATTTEASIKVEDYDKVIYMYAKSSVNVRTEPDADSERVGHLDEGEKVTVIGRAENGWYKIEFDGGKYFVSGNYLTDEAPKEEKPASTDKPDEAETYKLSLTSDNSYVGNSDVKYNSDGSAYIANTSIVGWKLPQLVELGEKVEVTVKGSSVGDFRMWLLGSGQATASNQIKASELGFNGGDFTYKFELEMQDFDARGNEFADGFCFKGPSWNSNLNQLTIKSVEFKYLGSSSNSVNDSELRPSDESGDTQWIASWGSAQLTAGDDQMPKTLSFANNTIRMQIRPSMGGNKLKLTFSNEFGGTSLTINAATLAMLKTPTSSNIDTSTLTNITFGGKTSVTISAGKTVTSDEIDFSFDALDDLAVTLALGSVPSKITSHTASRCSTWFASGNKASSATVTGDTTTAWYFLSRLDVLADKDTKAIVCLGDSLTDGASVSTNGFARWTDELARQLVQNGHNDYSVINMGIGGTPLNKLWGNSGVERFNRDVLNVPGVEYLILFYGTNDIGGANYDRSTEIINTYKDMIKKCHAKGIKVYGCTITPFKGNGYYSDLHEDIRIKVNKFIMSKDSGFDGYIDLASAVAETNDPKTIRRSYVSVWNDYLHFNDAGYKFVGKTIYEAIIDDLA